MNTTFDLRPPRPRLTPERRASLLLGLVLAFVALLLSLPPWYRVRWRMQRGAEQLQHLQRDLACEKRALEEERARRQTLVERWAKASWLDEPAALSHVLTDDLFLQGLTVKEGTGHLALAGTYEAVEQFRSRALERGLKYGAPRKGGDGLWTLDGAGSE